MSATDVYDAVLRGDCFVPAGVKKQYEKEIIEPVRRLAPGAIVVDASSVCEFVHVGTNKGSFGPEDFPSVVPPFPLLWLETKAPARSVTPDGSHDWDRRWHGAQWGALFRTDDMNELDEDDRRTTLETILKWWSAQNIQPSSDIPDEYQQAISYHSFNNRYDLDQIRWTIRADIFVRFGGKPVPSGPLIQMWLFVNRDGKIARDLDTGEPAMWNALPGIEQSTYEIVEIINNINGMFHAWFDPLLLTISFMNCRNVTRTETYPKRHDVREAKRRGLPLPTKYYTLQIEPLRKTLAGEGDMKSNGFKKALHICRGHFSHYTEEKPLFGKYSGQFWVPAHVRGSAESGKVVKDYAVKSPRSDTAA